MERDWRDERIEELEGQLSGKVAEFESKLRESIADLENKLRESDERVASLAKQLAELTEKLGRNSRIRICLRRATHPVRARSATPRRGRGATGSAAGSGGMAERIALYCRLRR